MKTVYALYGNVLDSYPDGDTNLIQLSGVAITKTLNPYYGPPPMLRFMVRCIQKDDEGKRGIVCQVCVKCDSDQQLELMQIFDSAVTLPVSVAGQLVVHTFTGGRNAVEISASSLTIKLPDRGEYAL